MKKLKHFDFFCSKTPVYIKNLLVALINEKEIELNKYNEPPSIFIMHGYMDNTKNFQPLGEGILKNQNSENKESILIHKTNKSKYTSEIEEFIDELFEKIKSTNLDKHKQIVLIGHSMGGLIQTWVKYKLMAEGYVEPLLITIGTPFRGTKLAYLPIYSKCADEMKPGSPFLKKTNEEIDWDNWDHCRFYSDYEDCVVSEKAYPEKIKKTSPKIIRVHGGGHITTPHCHELHKSIAEVISSFHSKDIDNTCSLKL